MRMIGCFLLLLATAGHASEPAAIPPADAVQAMAGLSNEAQAASPSVAAAATGRRGLRTV